MESKSFRKLLLVIQSYTLLHLREISSSITETSIRILLYVYISSVSKAFET